MSEKEIVQSTNIFDSAVVPWVLVGTMIATGFLAACFIVLR